MPRDVTFASGSFGAWLQANKGMANFKEVPALYQTAARRLHAGEMAPNSPMLAPFADRLGVSAETLRAFATAPPMAQSWVNKIHGQLVAGTIPRGTRTVAHTRRRAAKPTHAKHAKHTPHAQHDAGNAGPLARLLAERSGMPVAALAKQLGISQGTMNRLSAGQLGANHPLLPPLATALKIELRILQKYMHGPRLNEQTMNMVLAKLRPAAKAKAAALAKRAAKQPAKQPGTSLVHVPRDAKEPKAKRKMPAKYNKLRGTAVELREAARSMCATLNVAVMRGDTHSPPLPLRELHLVLVDYLQAKGVRANVLVDPEFATVFDPR